MARNPQLFNITSVGLLYDRYFEAVLGYWLTNANQSVTSSDYKTYGGLLGGSMDPTDPSTVPNYQGQVFIGILCLMKRGLKKTSVQKYQEKIALLIGYLRISVR